MFAGQYRALLLDAVQAPKQYNFRTGEEIRLVRGGRNIQVNLRYNLLPLITMRKTFPRSAAAELAWYLQGTQDPALIMKYAPRMWEKFIEDGLVKNSYGYRWRTAFGRDQINLAIETLRSDNTSRQVYIGAWDPSVDGLGNKAKNIPCPVGFQFHVQDGELHSTMMLRSSDLFVGLPYDVMGHALLMKAMAVSLNAQPGIMQVSIAHAHLYERHVPLAQECLKQLSWGPLVYMPDMSVMEITRKPELYVDVLAERAAATTWPEYNPKPDVVE